MTRRASSKTQPPRVGVIAAAVAGLILISGAWSCQLFGGKEPAETLPSRAPTVIVRVERAERSLEIDWTGPILLVPVDHDEPAGGSREPVAPGTSTGARTVRGPLSVEALGDTLIVSTRGEDIPIATGAAEFSAIGDGDLLLGGVSMAPVLAVRTGSGDRSGTVEAAAVLKMDAYIAGVIAAELPSDWLPEAYAAQAVAARSYALHQRGRARRSGRWYDLDSTTADQVFKGLTARKVALDAARETSGRVLLDENGAILRAYYSSTCGGRPASAMDVWGDAQGAEPFNAAKPLQAKKRDCPCDASPLYTWTRIREMPVLLQRWREWGRRNNHAIADASSPKAVVVRERNRASRPTLYLITDDRGQRFELTGEQLRNASNTGAPSVTRESRLPSGDVEVSIEGRNVVFIGRGFGHGVGLCQYGAQGYAEQGETYQQMLDHFYRGAKLETLW